MEKEGKLKVLVLGNKGMIGHVVERYLQETGDYAVKGINRGYLDVSNFSELDSLITNLFPDIIINCVGILKPNSTDIQKNAAINVALPVLLAHITNRMTDSGVPMKVIHLSSNCVFKDEGPHYSTDVPNADDLYGMSKAMGEIIDKNNLTIRMSTTGPELKKNGINLFNWFVNKSEKELNGFVNALWNGMTTLELAKFIDKAIKKGYTGIINYYTKENISKCDLLEIINDVYGLGKKITPVVGNLQAHTALLTGPHFTEKSYKEQFKEMKEWYSVKAK